ncbi:hypothetical protein NDU88_005142 [Pleurodeles waltl]|uniref:Uncharacterized protein n=1 Tax=Pleurodeles waltl TaxID=8319 RepID=A0AAV7VKW5_PLEWA|nr:hypothetical protein NDU88_005142 [Pleurodeles waltl]
MSWHWIKIGGDKRVRPSIKSCVSGRMMKQQAAFIEVVYSTAIAHLDQKTQKNTGGFNGNDKEIQKLLDEKPEDLRSLQLHIITAFKKVGYSAIKSKVKAKFREMQGYWLKREADKIQGYVDSYKSNSFYDPLKSFYRPQSSGPTSLFSADWSTMFTNRNNMLTTRAEHFNNILDRSFSINAKAFDRTPQVAINTSLAEPPKESEDKEAIKLLSND